LRGLTLLERFKQQQRGLYRFFESRGEGRFLKNLERMGPFVRWFTRGAGRLCFSKPVEGSEHLPFSGKGRPETPL
jgi:hypothetical protein